MSPIHNVIVAKSIKNNVNVTKPQTNNDNVLKNRTEKEVDQIAADIMQKLGANSDYKAFYCRIVWRLSDATIYNHLEQALKGNSPAKYFTWLCKKSGV